MPPQLSSRNLRFSAFYLRAIEIAPGLGPVAQVPGKRLHASPAPRIGEVTCKSSREALSLKVQFSLLELAGMAIWAVSTILGIDAGYLWLTVIVLRIFETAPYWFYREPREPTAAVASVQKAESAATI